MKGERKEEWKRGMEGKRKLKREMKKENDRGQGTERKREQNQPGLEFTECGLPKHS